MNFVLSRQNWQTFGFRPLSDVGLRRLVLLLDVIWFVLLEKLVES